MEEEVKSIRELTKTKSLKTISNDMHNSLMVFLKHASNYINELLDEMNVGDKVICDEKGKFIFVHSKLEGDLK